MATLTDTQREKVWRGLMRYLSSRPAEFPCSGFTKAEFRAAINAVDVHIEGDKAAYVGDLPEPFRTASGASLKSLVFLAVAAAKGSEYISGDLSFARELFGDLD